MAEDPKPAAPDHSKRGHSPLGASGAERWMECPGSVALIKELKIVEDDAESPRYRLEGTAMHEAAEKCLKEGIDTWEIVGQSFGEIEIDPTMADAIQVYLDYCRRWMDAAAYHYVELPVSSPVHPDFYGSLDFAAVVGTSPAHGQFIIPDTVVVCDLKGGEGIIVEPEDNPQLMYYAFGLIDANKHWDDETRVVIAIAQPRAFHPDGMPIHEWETTVGEIREWVQSVLVPAMCRAEYDCTLDAGPWCRFCPAKLVCPLLTSLFRAAAVANPKEVVNYNDASVGRSYQYLQAVKFYIKALEEETLVRLRKGVVMEGCAKLVDKKVNRVFKDGAEAEAKAKFGQDAVVPARLKSPSELEAVSPAAKQFVKEYAYFPRSGFTVAPWSDRRTAVKVQTQQEVFGAAVAALDATDETT